MTDDLKHRVAQRAFEPIPYARSWALDDIQILRAADGHSDGRTVEAYATVFETPTEIHDQHGDYYEVIARNAFKRVLDRGIDKVGVYYHHGLTIHGTPSDLGSVPIGSPVDIRADGKGLRTVSRFNASQLADSVLEAIRAGDIKGYSFRGRIYKSNPMRLPRARPGASLPTVTRTELGLTEYGPTPTPAYADAGILAMRSTLNEIREELASLSRNITSSTPADPDDDAATPDVGPGAEDPRDAHSVRQQQLLRLRSMAKFLGV